MIRFLNSTLFGGTSSFNNNIYINGNIVDASGSTASTGYFLMASGSNVYWIQNPSPNYKLGGVTFYVNGQGTVVMSGMYGGSIITYNGTITSWQINTLYESPAGSITFDILRNNISLVGTGTKPNLSSTYSATGSVANWSYTTLNSGDFLYLSVTGSQTLTGAILTLFMNKTTN